MTSNKKNIQRFLSLLTIILGIVLLVFMIVVEGEPGAIPVGMIIIGSFWFTIIYRKEKTQTS